MASIAQDPGGRKRLTWMDGAGKRWSVRLGVMTMKAADAIKTKVEAIVSATLAGTPLDRETALWIAKLPPSCMASWPRRVSFPIAARRLSPPLAAGLIRTSRPERPTS